MSNALLMGTDPASESGTDQRNDLELRRALDAFDRPLPSRMAERHDFGIEKVRREIEEVRQRIQAIEAGEGDLSERRRKVAEVLGSALCYAARHDSAKVSEALAPLLSESIRYEVKHSREEMVAALYPLAGRLVAAAVADAFGKVIEDANARIDSLFSLRGLKLKLKSLVSGKPVGELLLADLQKTEIEHIYLIDRSSGGLTFCWPGIDEADAPEENVADEIIGAVIRLCDHASDDVENSLRSIDLNDRHLVLRASPTQIVVIEVSGPLSAARSSEISDACLSLLEFVSNLTGDRADVPVDKDALSVFARRLAKTSAAARGGEVRRGNPAAFILGTLAVALVAFVGARAYDGYRIGAAAQAVETTILNQLGPDNVMLNVDPDRASGTISVRGVTFRSLDVDRFRIRIDEIAAPYDLSLHLVTGDSSRSQDRR